MSGSGQLLIEEESAGIRELAPNPVCWVLQGSEQLIMNLIKGSRSLNLIWVFSDIFAQLRLGGAGGMPRTP